MSKTKANKAFKEIDALNEEAWSINRDQPEKAIEISEKSLKLARDSNYELGAARANHNMGMCFGWLSEFEKALEFTESSLKKFLKLKSEDDLGRNYYSLGTIYYFKGDFKKSRENYEKSLENYQSCKNETGITNAYNGLGSVYTEIQDYDEAGENLIKGLELSKKIDEVKIRPKILHGLASISTIKEDYDKAIGYYNEGLKIVSKSGRRQEEYFHLQGIGEVLTKQRKWKKALEKLEKSLELSRDLNLKLGEAKNLEKIGLVYLGQKDLDRAESYLQVGLRIANEIDSKGIAMSIYQSLSALYEAKDDTNLMSENLKNYYELKEYLVSEENLKAQNAKLEQAFSNTKILSEIGQEIIASLELEKVLFTIYEKVNKLMDATVFGIGLYHPEGEYIDYRLAIDSGKKYEPYKRDTKDKNQLAVWCIDNKKPVFINHFDKEYKEYIPSFSVEVEEKFRVEGEEASGMLEQSILYVPIMSGKDVLGVISVQSRDKNVYDKQHLDVLSNIAVYAAIAMINAQMYQDLESEVDSRTKEVTEQHDKLQQTYEDAKVLNDIGQDISSSLSIKEVVGKVYKNINIVMDASVFVIGLHNPEKNVLFFEGGMEKGKKLGFFEVDLNEDNRLAVLCFKKSMEIIMHKAEDEKKYVKEYMPPSAGENTESVIYLPLKVQNKTTGVISIQSFEQNAFSDYHITLLRSLANHASIALENAMMYGKMEEEVTDRTEEINRAYNKTKILNEIGQEINSSLSIVEITKKVYKNINTIIDASVFWIGVYREDERALEFRAGMEKGVMLDDFYQSIDDDQRPGIVCFKNNKEVLINDFDEYRKNIKIEMPAPAGEDSQSIIYHPLNSKGKTLGVITLQSFEKNAYEAQDHDIVRSLANPIATAIENAILYEELEQQVEERTKEVTEKHKQLERTYENTKVLNEIGQDITSSLSMKEVIQKVYKSINSLMDATVFLIALYNPKKNVLVIEGGMEKDKELPYIELDLDDDDRPAVICFKQKKEIIINDRERDIGKYVKEYTPTRHGVDMESVIYFPLVSKDKVLGVFTVQSLKKEAYSEYHIDLLRNLALYTPIALDNALMYRKMEKEVESRTKEIERSYQNTKLLSEIGLDIISTLSIDHIADTVYEKVNTLMDAISFGIGLYNKETESIDFVSEIEKGERMPMSSVELSNTETLATYCFLKQKEVFINDFGSEYSKYISVELSPRAGEETWSIIYVPLTLKDKKIGVLTVQSFEKNAYTQYDLDILKNLGVAISTAVENATMYEDLEDKVKDRTEDLVKEKEKAEFEREEAKYQRKRAEQSERFKQQFLANMSHEIRTPMNAIMGMTNLLLERNPPEQAVSYLDSIKKSSESLLVIINDILDLSKIEAGKMELEQADFSLEEVVRLVEQTMAYRADEKGLVLSVTYDEDIPPVLIGDPVRLQQVLLNIAGNAVKFTEKGGVTISVNLEGGTILGGQCKLRFEIRDTGIGMSQEQQSKVFESFSQAAADTTRKYGGTGLGLSISNKLIELFGSHIQVESKLGEGSTFTFIVSLPVSDKKVAVNKETEIPADFIKEIEGIKVLLAEDNEYNQIVAIETLEMKIPGIQITKAYNGKEACDFMEKEGEKIDVVLMDVQMPEMDGFEATRAIKEMKSNKINSTPIIALTASVVKKDIQMCFDAGMISVVPKPFKTSELIEAIYKACSAKENGENIYEENQSSINNNMDSESRITSLTFLEEFTEGDQDRINRYVGMYLDSAEKNDPQIQNLMDDQKWDELKVLVHSMKPHFDFMGMKDTRTLAEGIEQILVAKTDLDAVPAKIQELRSNIQQSIQELKN